MQYDKKVIDINTHPYLLEDVCRTQEQYQLVYDVTGLTQRRGKHALDLCTARLCED